MLELSLLKFLHVIGLAYWLGGDLGVFYSSFAVTNDKLSPDVRTAAGKTLFALDQAPRICMTLMLPLGVHLAWRLGAFSFDASLLAAMWVLALGWTTMVVVLHFGGSGIIKNFLTVLDYWLRVALVIALMTFGLTGLSTLPYWIAWKLIIFGALIFCGLMVRIVLREFGPAFGNLAKGQPSAEDNAAIKRSLGRVKPFVITIWIGLFVSAALGVHLV